jgi:hypothetical protein
MKEISLQPFLKERALVSKSKYSMILSETSFFNSDTALFNAVTAKAILYVLAEDKYFFHFHTPNWHLMKDKKKPFIRTK